MKSKKKMYNCVGFSPHSITELKEKINRKLENNCITNQSEVNLGSPSEKHLHNLTVNDLKKAIDDLKKDKKDESGLSANHLKNGTHKLYIILTMLFNCMLRHGFAPDSLLQGTMLPLVKDKRGKLQDSSNYRAITIGSSILKLFEIVILNKQSFTFQTSDSRRSNLLLCVQ